MRLSISVSGLSVGLCVGMHWVPCKHACNIVAYCPEHHRYNAPGSCVHACMIQQDWFDMHAFTPARTHARPHSRPHTHARPHARPPARTPTRTHARTNGCTYSRWQFAGLEFLDPSAQRALNMFSQLTTEAGGIPMVLGHNYNATTEAGGIPMVL